MGRSLAYTLHISSSSTLWRMERNHEVRALRSQVTILQRLLKENKKKVREFKEENRRLKKLVDSYANDLVTRSTEQSKTTTEF
uniref:Uncharacterized protein n=1 Tax=Fagus sylvatica TaxID=28930 RepID=A0A2N9EWT0_FAGSY